MRVRRQSSVIRETASSVIRRDRRNLAHSHDRRHSVSESAVSLPFGTNNHYREDYRAVMDNEMLQSEVNYLFRPYAVIPTAVAGLTTTKCFYFCGFPQLRLSLPFISPFEFDFPTGFGIKAVVVGVSDAAALIKWRLDNAFAVFAAVDYEVCTRMRSTSGERIVPVRSDGNMPNANELSQQNTGMFYIFPLH